jgi:MFS family permease
MPPKLNLILQLVCRQYIEEQESAHPGFTKLPASAFASPKLGALSDRYGRKKIIVVTSMGTILAEIITIFAATRPETFNVEWLLLGSVLDGMTGSFIVAMAITNSYITDCTPPAGRNVAFGLIHGCLFSGIAFGPIIAGYLVKYTGKIVVVFYILLGVHTCFAAFMAFVVPESVSKKRQLAAREKHEELRRDLRQNSNWDWINQLRYLVFLAAVDTIVFGVAMGSMTVVIIYTNFQFGWKTFESSRFMSIVNSCRVFCLLVVLPLLTKYVRRRKGFPSQKNSGSDLFDLSIIRFAVLFDTLGYLGYTLSRTGNMMILSGSIAAIGGVASPTLQAAMTKHVPPEQTGQLLGASGLLHALARVVAPTIFNGIYAATVGSFTQTVFVCLTVTFGLAFVISWVVKPHGKLSSLMVYYSMVFVHLLTHLYSLPSRRRRPRANRCELIQCILI